MSNTQRAFTLGFGLSILATGLFIVASINATYPDVIVCIWQETCDGGVVPVAYQIAFVSYACLNLVPAILIAKLGHALPGTLVSLVAVAAALMLAGSGLWWWLLAWLGARIGLWRTTRRIAIVFAGLSSLTIVTSIAVVHFARLWSAGG